MAELFHDYEVTHAPRRFWERLLRLFAISSVTHVALVLVVLYVPTVRGMLGIASTFGGIEFVDEDYTSGKIRERATMLTFTGAPDKLYYPPGYFTGGIAPPEDIQVVQQYTPPPPPPARRRPVRTPKAQPSPEPSPSPAASPEVAAAETPDPQASPSPGVEPQTEEDVKKVVAETGVKPPPKINAKPFKDLLVKSKEMKDAGKLDLSGTIQLAIEADLKPDGSLDNVDYGEIDPKLMELTSAFVKALSDSGALSFITNAKHLKMNVMLDQENVIVEVITEVPTSQLAEQLARGYSALLLGVQFSKKGTDEAELWKNMKVSFKDKQVLMKFDMKRDEAGKVLSKQLNKQAAST